MTSVNFYRTYHLADNFERVKEQCEEILGKYQLYPDLYQFKSDEKELTFKSEKLIPSKYSGRPRVMLLFSNPHPHSVHQGMLLSPNTKGRENAFWETMRNAGWINFKEDKKDPLQIANLCFHAEYKGSFDFVFYPYYTFPSNYPVEIRKIFGKDYFNKVIQPEAKEEFSRTIQETGVKAVVAFNKGVFNLVSEKTVDKYINRLINGELIESRIEDIQEEIPVFLTFPTGWRYHKEIKQLRKKSLDLIKTAIHNGVE